MRKTLILALLVLLAGCGLDRTENRPVYLTVENFASEMELISQEVNSISEIDLTECEIGYALADGYQVQKSGDENTCVILLITSDNAGQSAFLNSFLFDTSGFTVAATLDIVGPDYPFILVPQGSYDLFYLTRVMAHEGLHAMRIKNRQDGSVLEEEVLAYDLQMGLLEKQYSTEIRSNRISLEDIVIPGLPEYSYEALEMEIEIYKAWKNGNLESYLESISYPGTPDSEW